MLLIRAIQPLYQIAMRIDQAEALTELHVLGKHRLQERRFPDAGFSDDVHVRETVGVLDAEWDAFGAEGGATEICDVVRLHGFSLTNNSKPRQRAELSKSESLTACKTLNQIAILVTDN